MQVFDAVLKNDLIVWFGDFIFDVDGWGDFKEFAEPLLSEIFRKVGFFICFGDTSRFRSFMGDLGLKYARTSFWCSVGDFNVTPVKKMYIFICKEKT